MRLGISVTPKHSSPDEWAEKLRELGCRAAIFPCGRDAGEETVSAYVRASRDHDLVIAEVKSWCNPMDPDPEKRARNIRHCQEQLRLADEVGANCCVNIAGACGDVWDGGYAENYTEATYRRIVETTREIIDAVNPTRTCYTLEPMPWMVPDSPEAYLKLLEDVNRPGFAVHMDIVNMISCPERFFLNTRFIEKCFALLGPYTKSCHVKDTRLEPGLTFSVRETACGNGALDIVRYAELADATDPDLPVLVEHLKTEEEYANSMQYLRGLLDGKVAGI